MLFLRRYFQRRELRARIQTHTWWLHQAMTVRMPDAMKDRATGHPLGDVFVDFARDDVEANLRAMLAYWRWLQKIEGKTVCVRRRPE